MGYSRRAAIRAAPKVLHQALTWWRPYSWRHRRGAGWCRDARRRGRPQWRSREQRYPALSGSRCGQLGGELVPGDVVIVGYRGKRRGQGSSGLGPGLAPARSRGFYRAQLPGRPRGEVGQVRRGGRGLNLIPAGRRVDYTRVISGWLHPSHQLADDDLCPCGAGVIYGLAMVRILTTRGSASTHRVEPPGGIKLRRNLVQAVQRCRRALLCGTVRRPSYLGARGVAALHTGRCRTALRAGRVVAR